MGQLLGLHSGRGTGRALGFLKTFPQRCTQEIIIGGGDVGMILTKMYAIPYATDDQTGYVL